MSQSFQDTPRGVRFGACALGLLGLGTLYFSGRAVVRDELRADQMARLTFTDDQGNRGSLNGAFVPRELEEEEGLALLRGVLDNTKALARSPDIYGNSHALLLALDTLGEARNVISARYGSVELSRGNVRETLVPALDSEFHAFVEKLGVKRFVADGTLGLGSMKEEVFLERVTLLQSHAEQISPEEARKIGVRLSERVAPQIAELARTLSDPQFVTVIPTGTEIASWRYPLPPPPPLSEEELRELQRKLAEWEYPASLEYRDRQGEGGFE